MEDHYMPNVRHFPGFLLSAAIAIAMLVVGSVPAWAQITQISVVVDENEHGAILGLFMQPFQLGFSVQRDPGPGGKPNALVYDLMNSVVGGDVILSESGGVISDLLRFDPSIGRGGAVFFYSDQDGGIDAVADIGLPTGRNPNVVTLPEGPLAQGFGAIYAPTAGQPGFSLGALGPVTYIFISDPIQIPEPASLFLLLTGGTALLGLGLLRGRTYDGTR